MRLAGARSRGILQGYGYEVSKCKGLRMIVFIIRFVIVIYDKKYIFDLCPIPSIELLKHLKFPKVSFVMLMSDSEIP